MTRAARQAATAPPGEGGFSLMEALVALLILGIAAAGLVRAAEAHIEAVRGLERRAAATWVAQNRLTELQLPPAASAGDMVEMLGFRWRVQVAERPTEDPDLRAVTVSVTEVGGGQPLVTIDGFVDAGTTTA